MEIKKIIMGIVFRYLKGIVDLKARSPNGVLQPRSAIEETARHYGYNI